MECGEALAYGLLPGKCPHCGSAWINANYDLNSLPKDWPEIVCRRATNLWRYQELLPFPDDVKALSLGEGWTPLTRGERLEHEYRHNEIWIKDERQNPTGSFKDRQASCAISALKAKKIDELVIASTGNAAAAYAAYCARAGIKLWAFLTSSVPAEKMRELALYGAEVVKVTGTYDQTKKIAADFASRRGIYCDTGAKAIPNKESMKTIAFEIAEQLGWKAPDWYIQSVSGGLGPLGVLKGFEELYEVGMIDRIPKIGVVQVEGCAPMVNSWKEGLEEAVDVIPDTLITILSTGSPGMAYKVIYKANQRDGGAMVAVSDGEAFRAMRRVARIEGFSVEPATSVAFAGLEKLIKEGYIQPDEVVVVNCSGHTFSAEKHALEDRYTEGIQLEIADTGSSVLEGLGSALEQLDEQVTSIVIIDDNSQDSRMIRRLLKRYKRYRIFEADNGPDGIDLARQRKPELIILDLKLPDMDGFSILGELKKDHRTSDIPVMIVSGKDLTPDQQDFLERTAASFMQKGSFSGEELVNQVLGMLDDGGMISHEPRVDMDLEPDDEKPVESCDEDSQPCILVIDDNPHDARLIRRLFESVLPYKVVEASSAIQALQSIKYRIPDLIILDLALPDIHGANLLQALRLKKETENVPVIIVSSIKIDPELRAQLSQHADSIWEKPTMVRNHLHQHVDAILANEHQVELSEEVA
jgi:threonine synthase